VVIGENDLAVAASKQTYFFGCERGCGTQCKGSTRRQTFMFLEFLLFGRVSGVIT